MLTTTVCVALSSAGLAIAFLTAYRRRFLAATRIAAVSLLPVGLALAGLIELGGDVGEAFGTWAADLVLDPAVWAGFGVLAVSVMLFVIARFAGSRTARGGSRKERRAAARAERRQAASASGSRAAIATEPGPVSGGARSGAAASGAGTSEGGEDFSEIEAILRKHGI